MAKKLNQTCVLAINGSLPGIKFALYQVDEPLNRRLCGQVALCLPNRMGYSG